MAVTLRYSEIRIFFGAFVIFGPFAIATGWILESVPQIAQGEINNDPSSSRHWVPLAASGTSAAGFLLRHCRRCHHPDVAPSRLADRSQARSILFGLILVAIAMSLSTLLGLYQQIHKRAIIDTRTQALLSVYLSFPIAYAIYVLLASGACQPGIGSTFRNVGRVWHTRFPHQCARIRQHPDSPNAGSLCLVLASRHMRSSVHSTNPTRALKLWVFSPDPTKMTRSCRANQITFARQDAERNGNRA